MTDGTCVQPSCDDRVFIQRWQLCKRHYMTAWGQGALERFTVPRHSVADADQGTATGTCAECGPNAPVVFQADDRAVCTNGTKAVRLRRTYKLTPEQLGAMLAEADWKCRLCGDPLDGGKATHVDHDHACCPGKETCGRCVRGLLCVRCNLMLGFARDRADVLAAAAAYITEKSLS